MEIVGRIILALPEVSGTSKAGNNWKKKEYVLETQETYPKKVHFDFFGEKADQYPLAVGQEVKLYFDIESREYNGRWYTSIRGWKAEAPNAQPVDPLQQPQQNQFAPPATTQYQQPAQYSAPAPVTPPPAIAPQSPTEDLPF